MNILSYDITSTIKLVTSIWNLNTILLDKISIWNLNTILLDKISIPPYVSINPSKLKLDLHTCKQEVEVGLLVPLVVPNLIQHSVTFT